VRAARQQATPIGTGELQTVFREGTQPDPAAGRARSGRNRHARVSSAVEAAGGIERPGAFTFRHGASYDLGPNLPQLFVSYHPSQQNTFTGKLTETMLANVLQDIRRFLEKKSPL
jgi:hypothetical protein